MSGLIQQLRNHELTGCRGCDAIRKGLYKGLDLWKPDSRIQASTKFDSFDASSLGAFNESALKARGTGCAVVVDSVTPSTFGTGSQVVIAGSAFGAASSTVDLNSSQDKSGTNVAQTIVSWSDTSITIRGVQGALSTGTNYLFVDCQTVGAAITIEAVSTDLLALAILNDNDMPTNPPFSDWSMNFRVEGDITANYPNTASTYSLTIGPLTFSVSAITFNSSSFGRQASCGGTHTGGFTNFGTAVAATGFPNGTNPGDPIDCRTTDSGGTIDFWAGIPQCAVLTPGSPDSDQYHYQDPAT